MVGAQVKMEENYKGMDAHWNGIVDDRYHADTAIDGGGFFDYRQSLGGGFPFFVGWILLIFLT